MYSIGLDISKATVSVHVSLGSLDLEIENSPKAIKSFYSKLKKLYKKEIDKVIFVYEPTGSIMHPFFQTTKSDFLIPPTHDTCCKSFAPLESKLLTA